MAKRLVINRLFGGDRVLWMIFGILSVFSLLVVYSSTASLVYAKYGGNTFHDLLFQLGCVGVGFSIVIFFHLIDIEDYNKFAKITFIISLVLMALIYVPGIGQKINGAYRWIKIPFTGLTFQPSDLLKVSVVILLAQQLAARQKIIKKMKLLPSFYPGDWRYDKDRNIRILKENTLPILGPVVLACGSILAFNFSTSALLFLTCLLMLILGRVSAREIFRMLFLGFIFLIFAVLVMKAAGVGRVATWEKRLGIVRVDESEKERQLSDAQSEFSQVAQARIAIASGGILGKGPGNSTQRTHLPLPYSDFAYAFITEEYGVIGASAVLIIFLWIFFRSVLISRRCATAFPSLLVLGLGLTIIIQALTNMAVAVGLFPITGQPLPIISKGGTSIMFMCMALGIIIGVSRQIEEKQKKVQNAENNT
ncbi:MAG: FtsW/RodA/SpoVE family cell cycle protein [Rikenellaceae bacterium]|nr:FtsW/RodA/SpoVE family cell cycle protein [Rikenellaceae bacterium]